MSGKEQGYPVPVSINGETSSPSECFAKAFTTPADAPRQARVEAWNLLIGHISCVMKQTNGGPFEVITSNGNTMAFKDIMELALFYADMFDDACNEEGQIKNDSCSSRSLYDKLSDLSPKLSSVVFDLNESQIQELVGLLCSIKGIAIPREVRNGRVIYDIRDAAKVLPPGML